MRRWWVFQRSRHRRATRHELGLTIAAAWRLWPKTDLVLGIGTRLEVPGWRWPWKPPGQKSIRLDVDPAEMRRAPPDLALLADADAGTRALLAALRKVPVQRGARREAIRAARAAAEIDIQSVQPQVQYLRAIREVLPDEGIVTDEISQMGFTAWYGYPVYRPRTFISSGYQGTLGSGFPTALGVKVAHPKRPVVAICGDGGFMFAAQELASAVQYGIGVVTLVFNNNAYGNVRRDQRERFAGRVLGRRSAQPRLPEAGRCLRGARRAGELPAGAARHSHARPGVGRALADRGARGCRCRNGSVALPAAQGTGVKYGIAVVSVALLVGLGTWLARRVWREREAHARDVLMLDLVTDCFFVLDRQWRFTHINDPALRYFDMKAQQVLGKIMWEEFPMTLGTPIETLFRQVAQSGQGAQAEILAPVTKRWLDVRLVPTGSGVMAVFTDVTRRRVAQDAAAHNAEFLRVVADSVSVLIAYLDLERRYRFVNRRYAQAFGFADGAALGRTHAELCGAAAYETIRRPLECAFAGQAVSDEMPLHLPELGDRHLLANYRPDLDDSGAVRGVVLALSDITERVKAELALREADRRKDEFLATLAHELRNPLAPLMNAAQLLGGAPAARENARTIIDRQVRHMARLVDDLLDVSRITLGRITLRRERIGLALIVSHAVEASWPLIESSGHRFHLQLPEEPLEVEADGVRLAQAVLNLLNNAAKYTPGGGRIDLIVARAGEEALIAVTDTGVGIPGSMLPRVFDMFTQVDRSLESTRGGLGIGLTLAGRLVALHGGTLSAHSEGLGRGSRFEIRIPLAPVLSEPRSAAKPSATAGPPLPRRVLVVDDNIDAAESLRLLLQAEGHQCELAHDGLAAVAATARFAPDIVLLDIGLPGLNGYEAATRMRQHAPTGTRPTLVALTGWGQRQDRERAAEAGFDLHLTKPVDPAVIMALARDPLTPSLLPYAL